MNSEPMEPLSQDVIKQLEVLKAFDKKEPVRITALEELEQLKSLSAELAQVKEDEDKKLSAIAKIEEQITKLQTKLTEAYKTLDLRLLYMNNPLAYHNLTGSQPVKAINGKKAADNPDQEEMLKAITEDNIKEAISAGVDSSSNADILKWLAKEKLGKEEVQLNQSLRTKVYSIRKSLGY